MLLSVTRTSSPIRPGKKNTSSGKIQKIIGIQPFLKFRNGNSRKSMSTIVFMGLKSSVAQSTIKETR